MKKTFQLILAFTLVCIGFNANSQIRYLDDIFTATTVNAEITYATNISIEPLLYNQPPGTDSLLCDIYEPSGDTATNRPVVILLHTGSFLPPVANGQPTGSKNDLSIVEQCTRWAKKGYVAVAMNNRLGWNPTSLDQDTRTSSLLQAAYRGIQDAKAMVRYLRMTEATGNIYGIDESRIVLGGQGTGGYISLAYDALDNAAVELNLLKFLNLTNPLAPVPYVYPPIFGNPDGTDSTYFPANAPPFMFPVPFLWNIPNNASYSSDISMAFNIGGCLADSSWLEAGDVPSVSFHCAKDENGPYANGDVIEPVNSNFVVEVQGSYIVQKHQRKYNNNSAFAYAGISDPITTQSVVNNTTYDTINNYVVGNNLEGLYTFVTPTPSSTLDPITGQAYTESGAPWDWWDSGTYGIMAQAVNGMAGVTTPTYFEALAKLGNPDMSAAKGNLYLDTIQGYLNPRMYMVLFGGCMDATACNYDPAAIADNGTCLLPDGCMDTLACNYDAFAKCDDGTCELPNGCTDATACNYDAAATCDDGTCDLPNGCMDATACNYDAAATCDNGTCDLPDGCGDPLYVEYDASVTCSDASSCLTLLVSGINEVIEASTKIYPNPANNSLNIVSNATGINSISISNLNGQEVLNTQVNAKEIRLNISNLAKGIYIIDIKSDDATVKRELIIE